MKNKKNLKIVIIVVAILIIIALGIVLGLPAFKNTQEQNIWNIGKVDDWKYEGKKRYSDTFSGAIKSSSAVGTFEMADSTTSVSNSGTIGLSTGGAKDVENFRENIKNGYFPRSTDITYNGLFYNYYFDTKNNKTEKSAGSDQLFSPSYSTAISKDPISDKSEYYMTVGLNSNIKESDFSRKKLNLVVVLDISGSMGSSFNSYYYDGKFEDKEEISKSKMKIANESVNILIDQLKDEDRFGMVLFDDEAYLAKPLSKISETNIPALKNHILDIEDNGGTNFEAGYNKANEVIKEYENVNSDEYENRIIVITDAMPNVGRTSKDELFTMIDQNSKKGIYTSFIGVGVDFNTEVIEKLSDTKGANYYSVHSSSEFKERMGEQFEYMVTPLVFDLNLDLESEDYKIEKVYGSDKAEASTGNLMKVNTLFPSKSSSNGEVKGGVVLIKLKKLNENTNGKVKLKVSYKDRNHKEFSNSQDVEFKDTNEENYENAGIRKAIVLTRYANAVKNWILYERSEDSKFIIVPERGIIDADYSTQQVKLMLGENERTSQKLKVSNQYKEIFKKIKDYINNENKILKDDTFNKEIEILDILIEK